MQCPRCGSSIIVKNGSNANGKKKFLCKDCSRQFVENPQNKKISDAEWRIVDRLLVERISLAGIARAVSISKRWLQEYVKKNEMRSRKRLLKCQEMEKSSSKRMKCGLSSAIRAMIYGYGLLSREEQNLLSVIMLEREMHAGAASLWESLSEDCKKNGIFFTDGLAPYEKVFPAERHRIVSKGSGKTSHIERLNLTFRQRLSALVRKTVSFSRSIENLTASVWRFIQDYNNNLLFN